MIKRSTVSLTALCVIPLAFLSGCVERNLTIKTHPEEALVVLNDEEIGLSPVTVNFNWYGDYCVRIQKEGFETLNTHRELKGPWYDAFPFDFFAQIINPNRIVDSYEWTFNLAPKRQISREELIQNAREMQNQLQ
ncbi:MAG: PEGA domain-containing protein [Sedimentisphaerales bacterium]|nr:PEGA domain-containing protein [Sedimentisphaerales bacterium]